MWYVRLTPSALEDCVNIVYETNGIGFLGWITDFPGAYIRGKTLEDARGKIDKEINAYNQWLEIENTIDMQIYEHIMKCNLHVEDADSNIILDSELQGFDTKEDFKFWCKNILISGEKAELIYKKTKYKSIVDPTMEMPTFYGKVYCTIDEQYRHIVNVQNYYLNQIDTEMNIKNDLQMDRMEFIEKLQEKYRKEGNRLYRYDDEKWNVKKIIRRIIWHDRIHIKAIERMEKRLGAKT